MAPVKAKKATKYAPVRSVRVADPLWNKAVRRAEGEGLTMSDVLHRFTEGYANGMVNVPRMQMVYDKPAKT